MKRLFVDYLGEGLPSEYRELIEAHLAACPLCGASADSYRAVIRLARQLPPKPVPPHLLEQLWRAARRIDLKCDEGSE